MNNWEKRRQRLKGNFLGWIFLAGLSCLYGAWARLRRWLYAKKIFPSKRLPAKVICIGNLTAGGTGKTPAVLLAAQTLRRHGQAVAVLSRGYGAKANGKVLVLTQHTAPSWKECGDEPWMMNQVLKEAGVPVVVCADRAKAGEAAITYYHSRVLLLDDGFQHLKLRRDLDILLVNAAAPFSDGEFLPLGNLREPLSSLAHAGLVVITHADQVQALALEELKKTIRRWQPSAPILEAAHKADFLMDPGTQQKHPVSLIQGREVAVLSGLADPASFEAQLESLGARATQKWRYPDHHAYRPRELRSIEKLRQGLPLVTTFKDFTRFPKEWREILKAQVLLLAIRLEIFKGEQVWNQALINISRKVVI
ncbi:MAG: tetraacyldisaccharide 4'-kinase [Elusimicrobia bacterium]|nr:tetraacyldisaccharide 4'-kinase [Elusimicrobiota bacterium]